MATIKPIEGRSVHQIQSGQVIVDLCSVVKELVENSLDAGATSIGRIPSPAPDVELDVRFKGNGLDAIEVQDNGNGIAPEDFETIALKHYTSKLSSYDDLTSLHTFGFRGEALSSLCALSNFHITTARASDVPRGTKLDFEQSGKLKSKSVIASQKGTTVAVEKIFQNLPVRRKELEKNIKREYAKVLSLLQSYACISTGVRFSVSNHPGKGNKVVAFSTKSNSSTRDNISNVYGAKTVLALLTLDLELEMQSASGPSTQSARSWGTQDDGSKKIQVRGHISRPVVGEGRQTPDRQMFFVNSRPCTLPQVAKAINEVYKSYNVTQSPFIFANLLMDTNAYDVNVSPDKRTILLHDQTALLESLKSSLVELFDRHDQSVPQASLPNQKLPGFKNLTIKKDNKPTEEPNKANDVQHSTEPPHSAPAPSTAASEITQSTGAGEAVPLIQNFAERNAGQRSEQPPVPKKASKVPQRVQDFNARLASQRAKSDNQHRNDNCAVPPEALSPPDEPPIPSIRPGTQKGTPGPVPNAFDRMRPKRTPAETVSVTIGDTTTHMTFGTPNKKRKIHTPKFGLDGKKLATSSPLFGKSLRAFAAPGTQLKDEDDEVTMQAAQEELSQQEEQDVEDVEGQSSSEPGTPAPGSDASVDEDVDDADEDATEGLDDAKRDKSPLFVQDGEESDDDYVDETEKKALEEARVAKMIAEAEEAAAKPTQDNIKRATSALKGRTRKDSTLQLVQNLETSVSRIEEGLKKLTAALERHTSSMNEQETQSQNGAAAKTAEERLSLTVSKADFARMRILGQFNLGFILALRPASSISNHSSDELFIIDQHAADEKYNFERLSSTTVVQNQRLVQPRTLELTAVEEEIILEHPSALSQNGFQIEIDTSGDKPVGQRCRLVSLPMSKEVVFGLTDLEELIALLGEDHSGDSQGTSVESVIRPSKVRRMLAMRACRSSIMVGRNLTSAQMGKVVRHMGEMDKPWNCPHGRPTMRHLFGMDGWENGWNEGSGVMGLGEEEQETDWKAFMQRQEV
ncbi:DNA mismatch repair protein MutL [Rhizodiscina lignyota]|uniref:DNA mismatch repair protein PMS1 n=1 Tax=Rhizodiscina lignyota TaxID=1504668 RepID=A0A9P4ILX9_9PEZI|nr:DNA mismatch repair protein MutL [Rhizodiscina lignyota]